LSSASRTFDESARGARALTAFDRRMAASTVALLAVATLGAALVVHLAEPAQTASAPGKVGVIALVPALAALASTASIGIARRRGELRALASIGVPPRRARAGALVVAALASVLSATAIVVGSGDVDAFFPANAPREIAVVGEHSLRVGAQIVTVHPSGAITARPASSDEAVLGRGVARTPSEARPSLALALALLGIGWSLWASTPTARALWTIAVELALLTTATLGAFAGVGAARLSPIALPLVGLAWLGVGWRASGAADAAPIVR
jgi:hypothetical protein